MNAPSPWPRTLELAARALHLSQPNPHVGCVLVAADGRTIGEGHTQRAGQAHAEVMALRDAQARGEATAGSTAWVSLEPCSHHGRTPPCVDALIAAGVARVHVALVDPNPSVAGRGLRRLRAAGMQVDLLEPSDPVARAAFELNIGFHSRMVRGIPWVRAKAAVSLDGRAALPDGRSQWITSPEARADGQAWRARADTLLTGSGTVLQDDPRLTVRLPESPRQPHLAIVDGALRTPPDARLFEATGRRVLVYGAQDHAARRQALEARGATVVLLPGAHGRVDLRALLADLARRETGELHVEAGPGLNGALQAAGLVDEWLVYLAPRLLGEGRPLAAFGPLASLEDAAPLAFSDVARLGPDLRLLLRAPGRERF